MKRIFTILLAIALLLTMTACHTPKTEDPDTEQGTESGTEQGTEPGTEPGTKPGSESDTEQDTEPGNDPDTEAALILQDALAQIPAASHYDWADDLPRMDGSTSTIPLEAGIRSALFGISMAEAELQVKHSTTYDSFYNLLHGNCDLTFSVPLSDEQLKQAKEMGVELEMTKIAAEGFVFVVNAKNPVNTLTQQQLKDIYSGKITNWKEVGGNDAPIIAYQRNEDSGSQNFMHTFMGDTPLMEKLTEFVPSTMGFLMDAVSNYDNAENAIGYSVYAYAADMYGAGTGNGGAFKFIRVDGVAPSKATMADGTYPLLSYNYAVYTKTTPADAPLRKLVEWLGTDEGQRAVKNAGYIPLRPVGEMTEMVIDLYTAVGTGPKKPAGFTASPVWSYPIYGDADNYNYVSSLMQYDPTTRDPMGIDGLANNELENEINKFLSDTKAEFMKVPGVTDVRMGEECINGYLAVYVGSVRENYRDVIDLRTRIYDLVAGKQIPYSDLFFKGENYVQEINKALVSYFQDVYNEGILKREFAGLEAGHDTFTLTSVQYGAKSIYLSEYNEINIPGLYAKSVLSIPRNLTGVFDKNVTVLWRLAEESAYGINKPLLWDDRDGELLDETYYDPVISRKINTQLREIYSTKCSEDYFSDYYGCAFQGSEGCEAGLIILSGRWVVDCVDLFYPSIETNTFLASYKANYFFDLTTGEQVSYDVLLKDGWENAANWYQADTDSYNDQALEKSYEDSDYYQYDKNMKCVETVQHPDLTKWRFAEIYVEDNKVKVAFEQGKPEVRMLWAELPIEYII